MVIKAVCGSKFLVGDAASLGHLRIALSTSHGETISAALKQVLGEEEEVLVPRTMVLASSKSGQKDAEKNSSGEPLNFFNVSGQLIVTSDRCLFVSQLSSDGNHDMSIGAECIQMHAQGADPVSVCVHLEGEKEVSEPIEISFIPEETKGIHEACESIFNKLSDMVSSHPISPFGGDADGEDMVGIIGMMNGTETIGCMTAESEQLPGSSDDVIVAVPNAPGVSTDETLQVTSQFSDCEQEQDGEDHYGSSQTERVAMLARLDSILVVKPGLEIVEDQFADAEQDNAEIVTSNVEARDANKPTQPVKCGGQFDDA